MKEKQGITLIELVIVVIILILIASFAIFSGKDTIDKADVAEIFSEATNIQKAVNGVMAQLNLEEPENEEEWLEKFYNEKTDDGWYEIYGMDKKDAYKTPKSISVRENLNMDTIKRSYQVKFETNEVKLSTPITISGDTIQTYDEIRNLALSDKI